MSDDKIAIVGMSCRFPGAQSIAEYWKNLCEGVNSVVELSDEELLASGLDPELIKNPNFIKFHGRLEGLANFDAHFFGYSPEEAKLMDPQQRIFLEISWEALENAGHRPNEFKYPVGVFAGCAPNKYFLYHVFGSQGSVLEGHNWETDDFPVGTNPDALTARVSYKLGLTGPSIAVQTACSSSLVAVSLACDSLLDYRCDMALAGGVAAYLPSQSAYLYQEEGMLSKVGACRSFDANADGSVFGSGAGVVVLKRLRDALEDNDTIYAVISGWAVRNDGANRAGYTAPGVEGQAAVVAEAQILAEVNPEEVSYIEAHGSATPVGDPIEIAGLNRAFRRNNKELRKTCALGSVKTNVGHLDAAAGVAGLIKVSLALKNKILPKSLHYEKSNAAIDFEHSPFFVQTETNYQWKSDKKLIAGVSSFGLGGTNAHVVLEEPPIIADPAGLEQNQNEFPMLPVSAKTPIALNKALEKISKEITENQDSSFLKNAAYTLVKGRGQFPQRAVIFAKNPNEILKVLRENPVQHAKICFLFPGVGDQFCGAFAELYHQQGVFRSEIQSIAKQFQQHLDIDLLEILYPENPKQNINSDNSQGEINFLRMLGREEPLGDTLMSRTTVAQPATFALEYSLAKQMMAWGIKPDALIGHSIGEYVAACISGVLSLSDAIALVATRGLAIERLPEGAMLAVPLGPEKLIPDLLEETWLSAINGPNLTVVSGTISAIDQLRKNLIQKNIVCQKVRATHPFHSELLRPAAHELVQKALALKTGQAKIPYISNLTGTWISAKEYQNPNYWGEHLCQTVQFVKGIEAINALEPIQIYVEVGPGQTLEQYTRLISSELRPDIKTIHTGTSYYETKSSMLVLMEAIAKIWSHGASIDWENFISEGRRIPLPCYSFEGKTYWLPKSRSSHKSNFSSSPIQNEDLSSSPIIHASLEGDPRPDLGVLYLAPRNEIEHKLAEIWKSLFGYREIGIHDDFVALGGHSLLALQFANKLWRMHQVEMPIASLLRHSTIAKLGEFLSPNFSRTQKTKVGDTQVTKVIVEKYMLEYFVRGLNRSVELGEMLSSEDILNLVPELIRGLRRDFDFRLYPNEIIPFRKPSEFADYLLNELSSGQPHHASKNSENVAYSESIVFILSAVRSGSTLLRVMLAGHPQLFSPPEFHVMAYDGLQERARADNSPDQNQGIVSAMVEAFGINRIEAEARLQAMIDQDFSTAGLIKEMAEAVSPKLFVDKSPGNSNDIRTLQRIKKAFPNAKFICLFRHPYSVIDSVVKNRFVKLMEGGATNPVDFGEFVWSRSNSNILDFIDTLEDSRVLKIKYEDLVTQTDAVSKQMCRFLEIPYCESILSPYSGRRMRDGLGDPNFIDHEGIDPGLALAWRKVKLPRPLGRGCRHLALTLGYELSEE